MRDPGNGAARLAGLAAAALGEPVLEACPVGGGDICLAARLTLGAGRLAFAKALPGAPDGFFAAEAAGLAWLAGGQMPTPEVLAAGEEVLVLSWLSPAAPSATRAEQLGRRLAALHRAGAPSFGSLPPGAPGHWVGSLPLPSDPAPDPARHLGGRLLAAARIAAGRGGLGTDDLATIEQVAARLPGLLDPAEPPARLHGDLWSGNVHWTEHGAHLIDPAAHGGLRETDLAMLDLFGAPHLDRILAAYQEAAPLPAGWRERVPLHQLHPLLVHAALFGAPYGQRAAAAARRYL